MKTISEILTKSSFGKLVKRTHYTKELAFVFRNILDPSLAKNCQFANLDGSVVTVTVKNPAWATRLRYAIPDIIKNLRTQPEFAKVKTIRYLIQTSGSPTTKKKPKKLSRDNEILWQNTLAKLKKKTT